jgi:hypothetical protein
MLMVVRGRVCDGSDFRGPKLSGDLTFFLALDDHNVKKLDGWFLGSSTVVATSFALGNTHFLQMTLARSSGHLAGKRALTAYGTEFEQAPKKSVCHLEEIYVTNSTHTLTSRRIYLCVTTSGLDYYYYCLPLPSIRP